MIFKNRYFRAWAVALVLAFAATACSNDDSNIEPEKTEDPTAPGAVTITGLESGTIYNSVTFRIRAEEEDAVATVQIKIDNTVVATLSQAPFSYTLDTKTLQDGIHTVTAVVTDKAGIQHIAETRVRVRNTLLTVYVSEAVREYPYRAFIFLSDSLGNNLAAADYYDYQTGDSIRLTAPDFAGNTFYVTEVYVSEDFSETNDFVDVYTSTGISRGVWNPVAKRVHSLLDPAWNSAPLALSNPQDGYSYVLQSNIGSAGLGQTPPQELNMTFINEKSRLLVVAYHEGESAFQYSLVPSITAGPNAIIDLSLATLPATMGSLNFTGADYATVEVTGISGTDFYNIPNFGSNEDALAEYGYPGNAFSRYNFSAFVRKNGEEFHTSQMGQASATFLNATVNLTLGEDGRTLSSVTTGAGLDVQNIWINKLGKYFWSIDSPPGTQTIVLPEFPELLQEFAVDDLLTNANIRIRADDIDGIDGYQDYIDFNQSFTGWTPNFTIYDYAYREKIKTIATESFNGRSNKPSTRFRHSHPLLGGAR